MSGEPETDKNTGLFSTIPGKKMALFVAIIIIGGFFAVQAMFGFTIKDLVRSDVTDQAKVVTILNNINSLTIFPKQIFGYV